MIDWRYTVEGGLGVPSGSGHLGPAAVHPSLAAALAARPDQAGPTSGRRQEWRTTGWARQVTED